jgi:hypothetical protein
MRRTIRIFCGQGHQLLGTDLGGQGSDYSRQVPGTTEKKSWASASFSLLRVTITAAMAANSANTATQAVNASVVSLKSSCPDATSRVEDAEDNPRDRGQHDRREAGS